MTDEEICKSYGLRPACGGMGRKEITALLSQELVRCRLERRNAYAYWAHEVEFHNCMAHEPLVRVDFVQFEPYGSHTYTDAAHVERGTFTFYEVKSCMDDLRSGHGLSFFGDVNWVVMPVEVLRPYLLARTHQGASDTSYDRGLVEATTHAKPLVYGIGRNGWATFREVDGGYRNGWITRARPASEILMCMMRAMVANSGHSEVDHLVGRGGGL